MTSLLAERPMGEALIHIVDDDDSVRSALGRLFRSAGFEVQLHGSLGDFVELFGADRHACAIVDVRLGHDSGLDLPGLLARTGRSVPVVFITAHDTPEVRERAIREGAVGYLTKPVDEQALLGAARTALARRAER